MGFQLRYLFFGLITLPLLPFLFLQAVAARKRVGSLPDAQDPSGTVSGEPPGISLLVIGESTVAGVGVSHHAEGLTGGIAKGLAGATGRQVNWTAVGGTGYTARKVNKLLLNQIPDDRYDLIAIALGGNETFELNSPLRWKRDLESLLVSLQSQFPSAGIVIANMPPVGDFTAFPKSLQWYLGTLVNWHRQVIRDLPDRYDKLAYLCEPIDFAKWRAQAGYDVPMTDFFSDGVHPSKLTYHLWGLQIAERATTLLQ